MAPAGRGLALIGSVALLALSLLGGVAAWGTEIPAEAQELFARSDAGIRLAMERGRYAQAAQIAQSALEARTTILGADHPDVAISLYDLGRAHVARGKPMLGVPALEQALLLREIHFGDEDPVVADTLVALGEGLFQIGYLTRAAACLRTALEIRSTSLGPRHPAVAEATFLLAEVVRARGDLTEADGLLQAALEIWRVTGDDTRVAQAWEALAEVALQRGEPTLARERYEQALRVRAEGLSPGDPRLAELRVGFGRALAALGDLGRSEAELRTALDTLEAAHGPGHPRTAEAMVALGATLRQQGDVEGALHAVSAALDLQEQALGAGDVATTPTLHELGRVHVARGDLTEAKLAWLGALRASHAEQGVEHPLAGPVLRDIAAALRRQGGLMEAASAIDASLEVLQVPGGRASSELVRTLLERTRVLRRLGDLSMAERSIEGARMAAIDGNPDLALIIDIFAEDAAVHAAVGDADGQQRRFGQALGEITAGQEPLSAPVALAHARALDARLGALDGDQQAAEGFAAVLAWREHVLPRALGAAPRDVSVDEICAALPGRGVLVDLFRTGRGPWVAHVVDQSCAVARVTLGQVDTVDAAVQAWRDLLADPTASVATVDAAGRAVREQVWTPLLPSIGNARRVAVVADGLLASVPLAALPTDEGYLVEQREILELASPGALLRPRTRPGSGTLVMGSMEEGKPAPGWTDTRASVCSAEGSPTVVSQAPTGSDVRPGSEAGVVAVAPSHAVVWLDGSLHLGAERCRSALETRDTVSGAPPGLLAGVRVSPAGSGTDGVLTAEEIVRLRLDRVQLVALGTAPPDAGLDRLATLVRAWALTGTGALAHRLWEAADPSGLAALAGSKKGRKRPARQLRRWQLAAIEAARISGDSHPAPWAGVVVRGAGR